MNSLVAIKPWEPGFGEVVAIAMAIGFGGTALIFWLAWRADKCEAKEHGKAKFTRVRLLIIVAVIALVLSLLMPPGPERYQRTELMKLQLERGSATSTAVATQGAD